MNHILIRLIGWPAVILQRDPSVFDRWLWLRFHLQCGSLRTLDAGCGAGEMTLYAAKLGNHTVGLSFDERLNQIGRMRAELLNLPNAEFVTADLRSLDELVDRLGRFDQIICMETIEHIMNDEKLIVDLSQLLRSGGKLMLTTPYKYHKREPDEKLSEKEDGGHVRWGYEHAELRSMLDRAGIDVLAEGYLTGFVSQQIVHLMRRMGDSKIGWGLTFPLRLFQIIDPIVTRLLYYPYLCVAVVGVKTRDWHTADTKSV